MKVCIMQPHFLPFTGYFELIKSAELFVFYDNAQFVRASWHSRTPIIEANQIKWLSIPVQNKGNYKNQINEILLLSEGNWKIKLLKRLESNFHNKGDKQFLDGILEIIAGNDFFLCELNIKLIEYISNYLGLKTKFARTSDINLDSRERQAKILEICKTFKADTYICSPGSKFYIQDEYFNAHDVSVHWVAYHYRYFGKNNLNQPVFPSIMDAILNKGIEFVLEEIKTC